MGETLEVSGPFATQGEFACSRLGLGEVEKYWPEMLLELRKIKHLWDIWWTEEALYIQCVSGNMQVWVAGKPPSFSIVVFSQILHYPANSVLQAVLMFGTKVDEVLPVVVGTLEHFALEHGCKYAEVFGRHGWSKKLENYGFRASATMFSKPLGELRRH